jgi:hypothetical protein
VLEEVLPSDVHDERQLGTNGGDVGEILVRADADVDPALYLEIRKLVEDVLVRGLVRDVVVAPEVAALFGNLMDEARELHVGQARRAGLR